jgi:hypothetical protein
MTTVSIPLPNGAQIGLATGFGTAKVITSISNTDPAVASATANGIEDGDVVLLSTVGWVNADNQVHRAMEGADANKFELPTLDATSIERFPVGSGAGSARVLTTWSAIPKVPSFEMTGGDATTAASSYIDKEKGVEFITGANPERLNFTVSYQPDSQHHKDLLAAHRSGELQVIRMVLKGGATLYYPGQLFFNPVPSTNKDQEMVNNVTLTIQGEITRLPKFVPVV